MKDLNSTFRDHLNFYKEKVELNIKALSEYRESTKKEEDAIARIVNFIHECEEKGVTLEKKISYPSMYVFRIYNPADETVEVIEVNVKNHTIHTYRNPITNIISNQ